MSSLLRREIVLVTRGVEHGGALVERHGTQILKRALNHLLTIGRKGDKLAACVTKLHLLLRRHAFNHLAARQAAFALSFWHLVEIVQLLDQPLLRYGRQAIETGIVVKEPLLILQRKPLVLIEPCA